MDKRARERDKDKGLPPSKRKAKGKLVEGQITTDQIQGPGPAPPPPTPTESTPTCKLLTQKTGQVPICFIRFACGAQLARRQAPSNGTDYQQRSNLTLKAETPL